MTPSVRFQYTASVVSGERCHSGYSRLDSMELPGLFLPTTLPRYGAVATFAVAMAVMLAVNATGTLRLSEEGELFGMDLHEHGISAYPEYVISPFASPAGMAHQSVAVEPRAGFKAEPVPRPRTA